MKCWFCGGELVWNSDFTLEEWTGEGEGLVSVLTCCECECEVHCIKREDERG